MLLSEKHFALHCLEFSDRGGKLLTKPKFLAYHFLWLGAQGSAAVAGISAGGLDNPTSLGGAWVFQHYS